MLVETLRSDSEARVNGPLHGVPLLLLLRLTLRQSAVSWVLGCEHVGVCRWSGGNGPRETDFESVRNLVDSMPASLKHVTMVTSAGVDRADSFPFLILNAFGVCPNLSTMHLTLYGGQIECLM